MPSALFSPITLRQVTFQNRIVVAPMCQYSAEDGHATDWHMQHLGSLSLSAAGLVMTEVVHVTPEGRITRGCLSLHSDGAEAALGRVIAACRRLALGKLGMQVGHAGRKASAEPPWRGGNPLTPEAGAWQPVAPSPIPFAPGWPTPRELTAADIEGLVQSFVASARRADRIGFDVVELHSAHGYLLHEFLSPLSNQRRDDYGGSRANRMRFPLAVARAVRAAWPAEKVLGARINATDWVEGGWTLEDAVAYAGELKAAGLDYVCVSSGGTVAKAQIPLAPGYMVEFAQRIRREVGIATRAVGLIAEPHQAEAIIAAGKADMIALARAMLDDPRWPWHAAEALGAHVPYPPQYERARAGTWPGAQLARPARAAE